MAKINVRSPYFVNLAIAIITSAKIEIEYILEAVKLLGKEIHNIRLTSTAIDEK